MQQPQQALPLQQEPLQQKSFSNQAPTQYQQQQQPPQQFQEFYQPATTTSQPNDFHNQQQQPVHAPVEPVTVTPNFQNHHHTSAMQQSAFANSPRQRSQNRVTPAPLSQQGEYLHTRTAMTVWSLQINRI
jgi:hypothetical protein